MSDLAKPLISAVIAAYNAGDTLARCIDSVLAQTYDPLELVIVDDGSTDDTPEVLRTHPARHDFIVIRVDNGGPSRARNLGVERARGELVAFFDADCLLHPRCVAELAEALDDQQVTAAGGLIASAGGLQVSPVDETPFGRAVQRYFQSIGFVTDYVRTGGDRDAVPTPHNPSCNVLYRRSAFEETGGFDQGLWPGEDVDLDHRASLLGYRHLFQRRAVVEHYRPSSPAAFARMMSSYGRVQRLLVRRHGFIRKLHYLPPAALAGGSLLAGGLWWQPLLTVVAMAAGAAGMLLVSERLRHRSGLGAVFYRLLWLNVTRWFWGFLGEIVKPKFSKAPMLPATESLVR